MRPIYRFEDYYGTRPRKPQEEFLLPIGISETGQLETLRVSQPHSCHLLITGRCGSGKSVYLHTLINSILLSYCHEQVNLWLYDYKACEFTALHSLTPPHITGQWTGETPEESLSFLDALEKEVQARLQLFAQSNTSSYERYARCNGSAKLPRLVVIIDDYDIFAQEIIEHDPTARTRLMQLLRMAHAMGILFAVTVQDVSFRWHLLPDDWNVHISTKQAEQSIMLQYRTHEAAALARELKLGEAIVDVPALHKVNLLYLSYEVEQQILENFAKA